MAGIFCQLMYSERLKRQRGEAYWHGLLATKLPVRTWAADSYDFPDNMLQQACDRAERTVLAFDEEEWIVSAEWETGTLSITGDVDFAPSRGQPNRVCDLMDSLFELLHPRFAWVDLDGPYPGGLVNDVFGSDIHWIFWLNYYGSEYLSKYGAKFFRQAPFESVHMFGDIGSRCLTGASPETVNRERILALTNYLATASMKAFAYGR
jgi:hypothetical protein